MKIEEFKSGTYQQEYEYRSFLPSKINIEWGWDDPKLNSLLSEANFKLGELNAFSRYVPNVDIFIRMHLLKEAVTSSRIEGTRTEVEEALQKVTDILPERKDDWTEVQNYTEAMSYSIKRLKEIPISTRLIKEAHKILMKGARGEHKNPGEFRTSQNWIGGATIKDARFIPPNHLEVPELMSDLENFLHNKTISVPDLIRIAITHYQFETIHPFLDGNGRIGRLLITLFLVQQKILNQPTLYLSDYFEKHRSLYYDNLDYARASGNLIQWIKFFLVAITETSLKGIKTFQEILKLKEKIEQEKIITLGKKLVKARSLLNLLYSNPVISSEDVAKSLYVTPATANALIQDFIKLDIIIEITGGRRNRLFSFYPYLDLFKGHE